MSPPESRQIIMLLVVSASLAASPAAVVAQDGWSLDVGTEPSTVNIRDRRETWVINRIQASYRESSAGGGFIAAESQKRESLTDELLFAGGYRRLGDWTISGQAGLGIDPDFVARFFIEPQLSRRLFGTFVGQIGYLHRSYSQSRIHIGSLAGIQYFPNGEIEARVAYGKNLPLDRPIRVFTFRGLWDNGSAMGFGGSVTIGDNLYDVINVPGAAGNRGWTVNGNVRYRIDTRNSVRLDISTGREDPWFRQRTLGVSYRRSF